MPVESVGREVLGDVDEVEGTLPGARHSRGRADDHVADQAALGKRREGEHRRGGIAAGVRDQLGGAHPVAVELGEPVDGALQQVGLAVRPVPALVAGHVAQAEVGGEVDDQGAQAPQLGDERCRRAVRVGDDRSVELLDLVQVQLLEDERDPMARVEPLQRRPGLAARADRGELEPGVVPDDPGGQRAGEPGGPGDEHPGTGLPLQRLRRAACLLTHATTRRSASASLIASRMGATSSSVRVRSAALNSSRSARLFRPSPTCSPR